MSNPETIESLGLLPHYDLFISANLHHQQNPKINASPNLPSITQSSQPLPTQPKKTLTKPSMQLGSLSKHGKTRHHKKEAKY